MNSCANPAETPDHIPVRMLNEYIFCPRLAYLEWVQGEFVDSADTIEGRYRHRRVDTAEPTDIPIPQEGEKTEIRSLWMTADKLGLSAKFDLIEFDGLNAVPVDYKRGKKPKIPGGVYDPERIQLCAQALILEENGFQISKGFTYFVASKERVPIKFTENLRLKTLMALHKLKDIASSGKIPEPLDDSPKCNGCSLAGICLPDETELLGLTDREDRHIGKPRMILPSADESLPVYVQTQGYRVGKSGGVIRIYEGRRCVAEVPLRTISHLAIFGGVQITTQALQTLCSRGIPICFFSMGGWFYGLAHGLGHKNIELRLAQYRGSEDSDMQLRIARCLVEDKIRNTRTLIRRNAVDVSPRILRDLATQAEKAASAKSLSTLLGIEGNAARIYFGNFSRMIKVSDGDNEHTFLMDGRNRRPPKDPINALLSFAYALLTKTWTVTVQTVGFDPYLGFYHRPRYGRPALALDLMEPFRPLIADSTVLSVINGGIIGSKDFVRRLNSVALKPAARSAFVKAFERRLSTKITHPVFGYKISYRQVLEVQARLLGRLLMGEIDEPPSFTTR